MFGRKRPTVDAKPVEKTTESDRVTSYRTDQDAAPETTGAPRTTSYVNAMQRNARGYETIN
ncbi:MAG: hypothetical protein JO364_07175 [Pseudonocardiales bacterium]|nr:hypothetical protein [Pseudonocardiales bacterium]MBV9030081.1 hypothetical protein [Pseudonocardiales bacterium]